ncbi:MAG: DNA/RNA nuclease SfsA [Gemmobacter sp.]
MRFQTPLVEARLVRRYKRFLADLELPCGTFVTAHCPNPGSMQGLAEPGARCWIARTAATGRKLGWSWKLVETAGAALVLVDTGLANRLVAAALRQGRLPGLDARAGFRSEVALGDSRVDFVLSGSDLLLEVKSVTLMRGGWAEFPDSVTTRGRRHLDLLATAARNGRPAAMLYLVARSDGARVRIAGDIDPAYAAAFDAARAAGVRMLAVGCTLTPEAASIATALPFDPAPQARGAGIRRQS